MSDLPSGPPDWPEEEVRAVRARLRELGADDRDLDVDAWSLPGVALDLALRRGATMSAEDLGARTGLGTAAVVDIYHELGIAVADVTEVRFQDVEADLLDLLRSAIVDQFTPEEGHELIVVVARSLRGMADAAVQGFVQTIETRLLDDDGTLVDWLEATGEASEMGLRLGASLGPLFNHYLHQAVRHQRATQQGASSRAVAVVAVGFVDLVGFTPLSSSLAPEELARLVGEFESRAFDLANEVGVRIVKHIGDEIMFTAPDPTAACRAAIELRDNIGPATTRPRGGVAYGEAITRHGDYYGPVVNLASRLTDEAIPGEILVPADLRQAVGELDFEPAGRRVLKGFEDPVTVFSL